jgi:hypothetical protein
MSPLLLILLVIGATIRQGGWELCSSFLSCCSYFGDESPMALYQSSQAIQFRSQDLGDFAYIRLV